jgi:hypothetical protein
MEAQQAISWRKNRALVGSNQVLIEAVGERRRRVGDVEPVSVGGRGGTTEVDGLVFVRRALRSATWSSRDTDASPYDCGRGRRGSMADRPSAPALAASGDGQDGQQRVDAAQQRHSQGRSDRKDADRIGVPRHPAGTDPLLGVPRSPLQTCGRRGPCRGDVGVEIGGPLDDERSVEQG